MMASGIDVKLCMSLDDLIKSKAVQAKKDAKPQARKQGGAAPKSLVGGKGAKPKPGNAPKSLQAVRNLARGQGDRRGQAPPHLKSGHARVACTCRTQIGLHLSHPGRPACAAPR